MRCFLSGSIALSLLISDVVAQGGKPETIVTFEPITDVRDQVCLCWNVGCCVDHWSLAVILQLMYDRLVLVI